MSKSFGATSTTDEVLAGADLHGERVLVTGVSAGLGVETARSLVARGAQVTGAVRDLDKALKATGHVFAEASRSGGSFNLVEIDLASLASVRACADALMSERKPFDVVIANAGIMASPFMLTADGFEMQLGANHLGHFTLINRIAPLIADGGRIVMLSSAGHRYSDVDLDDPNFGKTDYHPYVAYGRSKTANILFAVEFDRRHKARGVRATAVHPGGIATELQRHAHNTPDAFQKRIDELNIERKAAGAAPFVLKSVPQGAATTVWAAMVASGEEVGGRYCEDCHVAEVVGPEQAIGEGVQRYAIDPQRARALWARSEEWVGERF